MGPITENFMFRYMYERYMKKQENQTPKQDEQTSETPKMETIPEEPTWAGTKIRTDIKFGHVPE